MKSESIKNTGARRTTGSSARKIICNDEKKSLWLKTLRTRKNTGKSNGGDIEKITVSGMSDDKFDMSPVNKKTGRKDERLLKDGRNEANEPSFNPVNLSIIKEGELHTIAKKLVSAIYTNFSEIQRREVLVAFLPSVFKDTTIKIEKVARGRIKIFVNSSSMSVRNFFLSIQEKISAGLLIKGIIIDEFKIQK